MKLHYLTDQGIKCLTAPQAAELEKQDLDHATRDLFARHPARSDFRHGLPTYSSCPWERRQSYKWNIFDRHEGVAPLPTIRCSQYGKLVLNRNPGQLLR